MQFDVLKSEAGQIVSKPVGKREAAKLMRLYKMDPLAELNDLEAGYVDQIVFGPDRKLIQRHSNRLPIKYTKRLNSLELAAEVAMATAKALYAASAVAEGKHRLRESEALLAAAQEADKTAFKLSTDAAAEKTRINVQDQKRSESHAAKD